MCNCGKASSVIASIKRRYKADVSLDDAGKSGRSRKGKS